MNNEEFERFYFFLIQDKIDDSLACPLLILSDFVWKEPVKPKLVWDSSIFPSAETDIDK